MDIKNWLQTFNNAWSSYNVDKILSLFDPDVEYWETPSKKLQSFEELRSEWREIKRQNDIELTTSIYSSCENKHTVFWKLQYTDNDNKVCLWSGTYLITLNNKGLCIYFHQTGEKS